MMSTNLNLIATLTQAGTPAPERRRALHRFAEDNGWRPSDEMDEYGGIGSIANGHLVVEHGLDNTAVITFLTTENAYPHLAPDVRLRILGLSYNNLVDWHLFPDLNGLAVVFNRSNPDAPLYFRHADYPDVWSASAFNALTNNRPTPISRALDDALIDTIAWWKRALHLDLGSDLRNESIAALFNAILFIRAAEDHRLERWTTGSRWLVQAVDATPEPAIDLRELLLARLAELRVADPGYFGTTSEALQPFVAIPKETALKLAKDFYINRFAPYEYDFSVISKHALSRIYEHYISLLRGTDSPQPRLFGGMPDEISNRSLGGIYTPQYIARFFARFIKDNVTPKQFRNIQSLDPACGSGIFLRSLVELQCDPSVDGGRSDVGNAFTHLLGLDVDPSACHATRLSLALLHLSLTGTFPDGMQVFNEEGVDYFLKHPELRDHFEVITANPPFIKWDRLTNEMRQSIVSFLGDGAVGKTDAFLALLAVGLGLTKPGGFLLYVVPHSFLLARNAVQMRKRLRDQCSIRIVVDLSQIPVFEGVGSYVILLVLEKRGPHTLDQPAVVVRCRDSVGEALQDALDGRIGSQAGYTVYQLQQEAFDGSTWKLLSPQQFALTKRLETLPHLGDIADVREGVVTGADAIFIRDAATVSQEGRDIFPPLLTDREMSRFAVPSRTRKRIFHPFVDGIKLTAEDIERNYPETWDYLTQNADKLRKRSSVVKGTVEWWAPERSRNPRDMLCPKIVAPHLMLVPRFGVDLKGRFIVTRSPVITLKSEALGREALLILCAILNSPIVHGQLTVSAHRYSRGYLMLEPQTLRNIRVPAFGQLSQRTITRLRDAASKSMLKSEGIDENLLNECAAEAYGLGLRELSYFGLV